MKLLNLALYQTGWFACVIGAAQGYPWLGMTAALALLAAHLWMVSDRRVELRLILAAGLLGLVADSVQGWLGVFRFHSGYLVEGLAPPWIVVMWMQFASTLRWNLAWVIGNPKRAAVFGMVGGPLAFFAGSRLGAMTFGAPLWLSLLSIALVWALAMPALAAMTERAVETPRALGERELAT